MEESWQRPVATNSNLCAKENFLLEVWESVYLLFLSMSLLPTRFYGVHEEIGDCTVCSQTIMSASSALHLGCTPGNRHHCSSQAWSHNTRQCNSVHCQCHSYWSGIVLLPDVLLYMIGFRKKYSSLLSNSLCFGVSLFVLIVTRCDL